MNPLSSNNREPLLAKIQEQEFDLIIIGGGITGAGILLDATTRGLKTLLLEKGDFASGTSSRSTKLIHGGLRYLKQFHLKLVWEVGRERAILYKNAPHLVIPERMLLPLVINGSFTKILSRIGLAIYDVLASVKPGEKKKMLSKADTLKTEPTLNQDILLGGCLYSEYRTDDARLTLEVIKTACAKGGHAVNYFNVEDFVYEDKKIVGIKGKDLILSSDHEIKSKMTVNATGPWVDQLREKEEPVSGKRLHHTKGVHIVVPHEKLPINQAVYFDDFEGRMVFAIPRGKITYIGTTDTNYSGELSNPRVSEEEVSYLLAATKKIFPNKQLVLSDIISSYAGIRPLIHEEGKLPSEISREDEVFISKAGLVSIAGGKLTGFRIMASKVMDLVIKKLHNQYGIQHRKCQTRHTIINGGKIEDILVFHSKLTTLVEKSGLEASNTNYLLQNYGNQAEAILNSLDREIPDKDKALAIAELQFALSHESVFTLLDFFSRRTGRLFFNPKSIPPLLEAVADEMSEALSWDKNKKEEEIKKVEQAMADSINFGLS